MAQKTEWTPLMKAVLVNLSVLALWYLTEYAQFGELQHGRKADDLVFMVYFMVTWALFRKADRRPGPKGDRYGKEQ